MTKEAQDNLSTLYIIAVQTTYVTRLFQYQGAEPPTERQIRLSHGEEAANDVEAIDIYPLSELPVLRLPSPDVAQANEVAGPIAQPLQNYSVYVDQVETQLIEAGSEDDAVAIFHSMLTLGKLLSMVRVSAVCEG
jgi:hypothetical protein